MAKATKKKAEPAKVSTEKEGVDIFTRVVELKGNSVFVRGNETKYNSSNEAVKAFEDALVKTVW